MDFHPCLCPCCFGKGLIPDFWSNVLNDNSALIVCQRCGGTGLILKAGKRTENE